MAGWIRIDRKLFTHWIWKDKEPFDKRSAWVDLIGMASFEDHEGVNYEGKITVLKRGEIHTSMLFLAERWRWDRRKVKRFLSVLQMEKMVSFNSTTNGTRGGTVITIEKYSVYQGERTKDGTYDCTVDGTVDGTTDAHIIRKEEVNKGNNLINNNKKGIRPNLPGQTLEEKIAAYWGEEK